MRSHSFVYRVTMPRHSPLYLSMPILSTSSRPEIPSVLSISYSTGSPWQSQPKRRTTWWPVWCAYRVTVSLIVPARMWP